MAIKVGEKDLFPYLGDYGPVSIYKGEQKLAGYKWAEKSGQELHFDNTYNSLVEVEVDGQSYQHTEPTPDYPIEIESLNDFDVVSSTEKLTEGQLQEYDYGVEYENVDKINLSLSEPLRSVGDVKDRLFRDSDGLWKVERNVKEFIFDGTEAWSQRRDGLREDPIVDWYQTVVEELLLKPGIGTSSHFNTITTIIENRVQLRVTEWQGRTIIGLFLPIVQGRTTNEFKSLLSNDPITYLGVLKTPTIETLDQELQDKLNTLKSFKGSNYVYTVSQDDGLTPTIHAKTEVKDI